VPSASTTSEPMVVDISENTAHISVLTPAVKPERVSRTSSVGAESSLSAAARRSSRARPWMLLAQLIKRPSGNRSSLRSSGKCVDVGDVSDSLSPESSEKGMPMDITEACEEAMAEERRKRREARLARWTSEKMKLTPEFRDLTAPAGAVATAMAGSL
jgi:hypothetical protein